MSDNIYYLVSLRNYDENNIPYSVGEIVIKSSTELTEDDILEFCRDCVDINFESVGNYEIIDECSVYEYVEYESEIYIY